jgi:hypothetical protein
MTFDDRTHPVIVAATAQVKLCLYDKEEPHIWFRLIEAQFAEAGIRSQKLKYANALANLPKQVLWDILDTLDVCNDSDDFFDCLKDALLSSRDQITKTQVHQRPSQPAQASPSGHSRHVGCLQ